MAINGKPMPTREVGTNAFPIVGNYFTAHELAELLLTHSDLLTTIGRVSLCNLAFPAYDRPAGTMYLDLQLT